MWAILAPIFNALIAPITKAIAFAAAFFTGKKQGRLEAVNESQQRAIEQARRSNEARGSVRTDDDVDRLLKPPADRR